MGKSRQQPPIAILGAGSWGTALALYLSQMGQTVRLWAYQRDHAAAMTAARMNSRYMPGIIFPDTLQIAADLADAVSETKDILIAVPSIGFRDLLLSLKPLLRTSARILWVTKGLDPITGQLLHETALEILGNNHSYAILSGPSFAREVAAGLPTAVVVASRDAAFSQDLVTRFNSRTFRVYSSEDIIGVEIGGIIKNILAIATGISDGMNSGSNARSALITRGLAEMVRLGVALGGQHETFMGLTGLGDLILTCTDNQSRNRQFGLLIGQGKKSDDAEREIGQAIEGKRNIQPVIQLAHKHHVAMPVTEIVWEILSGKLTPVTAMQRLFARETKAEY